MTRTHRHLAGLALVAGLATALGSGLPARADAPCVELKLSGKRVVEIPCPEGLDRILELPLFRPAPEEQDDFAIVPDIPDDRDMAVDPEWPHDQGIIAEPGDGPSQMRISTPAPPTP